MSHLSYVGTSYPFGDLHLFVPIEQTIYLAVQPHKHRHCHVSCFILHLPQHFFVCREMQEIVGWAVTYFEESCIGLHVFIDVVGAYEIAPAVCVGNQEVGMVVLGADVLVVEIVHQRLAEVEDVHAHVDRASSDRAFIEHQVGNQQLHTCQFFIEDLEPPELRLGHLSLDLLVGRAQMYVVSFTHVLHSLAEHRFVHDLVEVLLKRILGLLAFLYVECNVGLKPLALTK